MFLHVLVEDITNNSTTLTFLNQIFWKTLLRPQQMVAELRLTDPLLELALGEQKIANNLSAIAEHYQKTSHEPDLDNIILCREDKLIPRKVWEAIIIRKETSPTLNRDGGCELSKIYDSLLETPSSSSRTLPPTSGLVSRNSATIGWRQRGVSPKYSVKNVSVVEQL